MKAPEFEEREYEGPLYNQLERGERRLWAPGQVLEARIGFDRSLFLGAHLIWNLHRYRDPLPGVLLPRIPWPSNWGPLFPAQKLPNFRLNLFVQAKRSEWTRRRPVKAKLLGAKGLTWSFQIESEQQDRLETLAQQTKSHALVVYAAPAFHTQADLWKHTCNGSIAANSTFPSIGCLSGHDRWYFEKPGASGVANPDPIVIDEVGLHERLERFASGGEGLDERSNAETELVELAAGMIYGLRSEQTALRSRDARFFDELAVLDRGIDQFQISPMVAAFLRISHVAASYDLLWLTVG